MLTRIGRTLIALTALLALSCSDQRPLNPSGTESPIHEPWEDEEAENLAWLISGEAYAPKELYDRIRADLAFIRGEWGDSIPELRTIRHTPNFPPAVWFHIGVSIEQDIAEGTYHDWDSLNALFKATPFKLWGTEPAVSSMLRVNVWRMLQSYEMLRGIRYLSAMPSIGPDRSNWFAFRHPWGIAYLYRKAWGDCGLGCMYSHAYYFRSSDEGIVYVGNDRVDRRNRLTPNWWPEAIECWDLFDYGDAEYRYRYVTPPGRVDDLRIVGSQIGSVVSISFTTPGGSWMDGQLRPTSAYQVCWLPQPLDTSNWGYRPSWDVPRPLAYFETRPSGETVTLTLEKLHPDTVNYIGIITIERVLSPHEIRHIQSPISNIVVSRNASSANR